MRTQKLKALIKALAASLISLQVSLVSAAEVHGVIVEDKASEWLRLMDAAKYDEAGTWLSGNADPQVRFKDSAKALRALHAEHGPTMSRLLLASEIESEAYAHAFEVDVTLTFINNGTAEETVRIGHADGQWQIFGYEVRASED